jgi:hypothetical protein
MAAAPIDLATAKKEEIKMKVVHRASTYHLCNS